MYVYICTYAILYTNARIFPILDHPKTSHLRWEDHLHSGLHQNRAVGRGLGSPWLWPSTLTERKPWRDRIPGGNLEVFGVVLVIARWGSLDFIWVTSFPPSLPNRLIFLECVEATNESFFVCRWFDFNMLMVKMPNQQPHVDMCNVYNLFYCGLTN